MKTLDKTAVINSIKENDKLLGETVKAIKSLETISYEAPARWYHQEGDTTRHGRIENFLEELNDIKKELFEESEGYGEILKTL